MEPRVPETDDAVGMGRAIVLVVAAIGALVLLSRLVGTGGSSTVDRRPESRDAASALLSSIGGLDALHLGTAEGSFDMVSFDPSDPDRLLASRRSSYGIARNESVNEEWWVSDGDVVQSLFDADRAHDYAHFTRDGDIAIWSNSGETNGYAARTLVVMGDADLRSGPIYASRSVVVGDTLFALTGDADYYSSSRSFELLVAERDGTRRTLDPGAGWSWIDSPDGEVLVAYPVDETGLTVVWDVATLERLPQHPLSGRDYQRAAISGDATTAVGIRRSGEMEVVDLPSGEISGRFGAVDPRGIDRPLVLNHDATLAVSTDHDGTVTLWWVGDDRPLAVVGADAGPMRVIGELRAPRVSSSVAPDASRVAVHHRPIGEQPTTWAILDTDLESWSRRADTG